MKINQRGSSYQVSGTLNGDRIRKSFRSRDEAEAFIAKCTLAKTGGGVTPNRAQTFGQWFNRCYELEWSSTKSARTNWYIVDELIKFFGDKLPLEEVDELAIDNYIAALKKRGCSDATINRKMAKLGKGLRLAAERNIINRKPKIPRYRETEHRLRFLSVEEEQKILRYAEERDDQILAVAVPVLVDTGLRLSEFLRIKCRDVADGQNILVYKTKNGRPRSVPMTDRVKAIIKKVLANRFERPDCVVFRDHTDTLLRHRWNRCRYTLGFDDVVLHTFRHTCASRLVQNGVHLRIVKQWMGHETITITERYAHLRPVDLENAASILSKVTSDIMPSTDTAA
jgi:integrase